MEIRLRYGFSLTYNEKPSLMINQQQTQRQQQKILPQQIQLLNILHLNTIALEQRICDEINDNPFLEEDPNSEETMADAMPAMEAQDYKDWDEYAYDDTYDYRAENSTSVSIPEDYRKPVADSSDFREQVKQQLVFMSLSADQKKLVEYVIDSLNDQGMLDVDPDDMANDISFSQQRWVEPADVKDAIDVISRLEPAGLGCRSIREFYIHPGRIFPGSHPA
jgi:RNA polymerase sigma-54 factor